MTFFKLLALGAILFLGLQAWIRLSPLPAGRLSGHPGPDLPGLHRMPGGVKVVRPLSELPPGAFARLVTIAGAETRARVVGTDTDPVAIVTRSKFWGFPDIALIWEQGGNLHVHSHLVFGRGDLGVNAARVGAWFARLEGAAH